MDEYLFIVLAKLKADRLKLEREQHLAATSQQDLFAEHPIGERLLEETGVARTHRSPKARWFLSEPDWPVRT
jgi:hypothetical protein